MSRTLPSVRSRHIFSINLHPTLPYMKEIYVYLRDLFGFVLGLSSPIICYALYPTEKLPTTAEVMLVLYTIVTICVGMCLVFNVFTRYMDDGYRW